ncbi:response regulator transcription factor [Pseudonocardia charpentierae]|uniref:Response regulator transcription factor n=1 Tax=Pseudonocardia charpentierae TaxID=3075545 RepID=A0ABU2NAX2_9PSEU|nr:response regulator transcription factor [Pseudonocardia sp. DSM 45834]MDT0351086.1 response regulator transcription factor [Pseudonocardia sp. DSM 45834]
MTSSLEHARAAFAARAWREAADAFAVAASSAPLAVDDHGRRAVAAFLVGDDVTCERAWDQAYRGAVVAGDGPAAARYAWWIAFCLLLRGRMAQAGGWLTRSRRLVDEAGVECAASGYLLIPEFLGVLDADPVAAHDLAVQAGEIGARLGDSDLQALGLLARGQALIGMGRTADGFGCLDDVMLSVTSGEVGPIATGVVYCAVILECMAQFDLARASEWTAALSGWCAAQPDLVPFRGQCLVHRSQLQQLSGDWTSAVATAEEARRRLADPPHPALGLARYQQGELCRLLGHAERAADAYRDASRLGCDPIPGVALLELSRGRSAVASASVRRALREARTATERPALLAAAVDIFCACGDAAAARSAAEELTTMASASTSPVLEAMAAHATGTVLIIEGEPATALQHLRSAAHSWRTLQMPYEAARTSVAIGLACAALSDHTGAELEFGNAQEAFLALGAEPDVDRLNALTGGPPPAENLSERERDVLIHLAAGKTNREIAEALGISPHTVRRHVEHIFSKLGVTSRTAATAHAYEHGLLARAE